MKFCVRYAMVQKQVHKISMKEHLKSIFWHMIETCSANELIVKLNKKTKRKTLRHILKASKMTTLT